MADTKISALTAATTPLAGTEVLPIVQSGVTKQVSVANLTAGRAVSGLTFQSTVATGTAPFTVASTTNVANLNASSLNGATFASPGAIGSGTPSTGVFTSITASTSAGLIGSSGDLNIASTWIYFKNTAGTTEYGRWTSGGDLINYNNFIQGTAAKGINFTANSAAAGKTSQLLNKYEEGTWTPTITAGSGTFTTVSASGRYTLIGRMMFAQLNIFLTNSTGGSGWITISNFPYSAANSDYAVAYGRSPTGLVVQGSIGTTSVNIFKYDNTDPITNGTYVIQLEYEAA